MPTMDSLGMFDLNQPPQSTMGSTLLPQAPVNQGKPYKSQLHELFQKYPGGGGLSFKISATNATPHDPSFSCLVECPRISVTSGSIDQQMFEGRGRSKKVAENAAAERALIYYADHGLIPPLTQAPSQSVQPMQAVQATPPVQCIPQVHNAYLQMGDQVYQQQMPSIQQTCPPALAHGGTLQAPVMQQFQAIQPHHQGYAMPQAHGPIPVSPASQASFQMGQDQALEVLDGRIKLGSSYPSFQDLKKELDDLNEEKSTFSAKEADWIARRETACDDDDMRSIWLEAVGEIMHLTRTVQELKVKLTRSKMGQYRLIQLNLGVLSDSQLPRLE